MEKLITLLHPITAIILVIGYTFLIIKLFRAKEISRLDSIISHVVRYALLLLYFSGIWMFISMHIPVTKLHIYVGLAPFIITYFFQIAAKKSNELENYRIYAYMYVSMLISVAIAIILAGRSIH